MNIDYSRLSRDEDKANYISIENQKKIIQRYTEENGIVIDKSFEDDGYSGYTMDRPAFNEIKYLIDSNMVDTLIAKDLSRIGRHNANVLLFLERAKAHNVRVILIDDNYDSSKDSDDMIGIKTWFNERYVVDGSRKVRRALGVMQETASLVGQVPYGYVKDDFVKNAYHVDPDAAIYVQKIFELYANGAGYLKVAKIMTEMGAPTPNAMYARRQQEKGLSSKRPISKTWTVDMIRRMVTNDFYIGTLRTKKGETKGINGKKKRREKEEHCIFENAHPPIISKELFNLVQELNEKRSKGNGYKGTRKYENPYAGLLVCGDCGRGLTVNNYNKDGITAYACRNYRENGKDFCSAHSIKMQELNIIVKDYLYLCRGALKEIIESLDSILKEQVKQATGKDNRLNVLEKNIEATKLELKTIMERKIKDITSNPSMADIVSEMYDKMQEEKMMAIDSMQKQIKEYENIDKSKSEIKRNFKSALEVFDSILKADEFTHRQINTIINNIYVYEDNVVEIQLKGELKSIFKDQVMIRMSKEERMKLNIINYITNVSAFGMTKLIAEIRKNDSISHDNLKSILDQFIEKGYVIEVEKNKRNNTLPPYICVEERDKMIDGFEIRTDMCSIHRWSNVGTSLETLSKMSTWIQRYI